MSTVCLEYSDDVYFCIGSILGAAAWAWLLYRFIRAARVFFARSIRVLFVHTPSVFTLLYVLFVTGFLQAFWINTSYFIGHLSNTNSVSLVTSTVNDSIDRSICLPYNSHLSLTPNHWTIPNVSILLKTCLSKSLIRTIELYHLISLWYILHNAQEISEGILSIL